MIEPWYQGLSILVHPSYLEGYSLVHVEAMASGCCVVASRLKYLDTLIEHGRTGFFFEPGDVKGMRELLDMLMREPERAREVGRNAAEHARSRCGIEHEAHALRDLYLSLLGDEGQGPGSRDWRRAQAGDRDEILHLLASPFWSGPAENVALLALAQREAGHEVTVAVDRRAKDVAAEEPAVPRFEAAGAAGRGGLELSVKSPPWTVLARHAPAAAAEPGRGAHALHA